VLPRLRRGRYLVVVSGGRMVGVLPPVHGHRDPAPTR
jgi:hypothetical protein